MHVCSQRLHDIAMSCPLGVLELPHRRILSGAVITPPPLRFTDSNADLNPKS